MYRFSNRDLDFMLEDIQARGVVLEDLQDNLLDHMCCILEQEMPEDGDFKQYYESILPRFFKSDLVEIQTETNQLLKFKNYYAMKKTLIITGLTSAIILFAGIIFKSFHLAGAGILFVSGSFLFSFLFLPLLIVLKLRDEETVMQKLVASIGILTGLAACVGVVFKLMHWPYATMLMFWGITIFVFLYVPAYFVVNVRIAEKRFNTIVNSVLMLALGGMLYGLMNLNQSAVTQHNSNLSDQYFLQATKQLVDANQKLHKGSLDKDSLSFFSQSMEVYNRIEAIKIMMVASAENVNREVAATMSYSRLSKPHNRHIPETIFEQGTNELSYTRLQQLLTNYNNLVDEVFPEQEELGLNQDQLPLKGSMLLNLLEDLSKLQYKIANQQRIYLSMLAAR